MLFCEPRQESVRTETIMSKGSDVAFFLSLIALLVSEVASNIPGVLVADA